MRESLLDGLKVLNDRLLYLSPLYWLTTFINTATSHNLYVPHGTAPTTKDIVPVGECWMVEGIHCLGSNSTFNGPVNINHNICYLMNVNSRFRQGAQATGEPNETNSDAFVHRSSLIQVSTSPSAHWLHDLASSLYHQNPVLTMHERDSILFELTGLTVGNVEILQVVGKKFKVI